MIDDRKACRDCSADFCGDLVLIHGTVCAKRHQKPYVGFSPFSILRPYGLGTKLIFGLVVVWPAGTLNVGLVKVVYPVFTADMILAVPLGTQME